MPNNQNKIPDFEKLGKKMVDDAVRIASIKALNFFKDSFQNQGWTDTAFKAWPSRSNGTRSGGAVLTQSGDLRNSLKILNRSRLKLVFGTNSPYAQIHNEGGRIKVTKKMIGYFWYMFKKTGQNHWKWLALGAKKKGYIAIPERQFIGHSDTLMKELHNWWTGHIEKEFKKHINNI